MGNVLWVVVLANFGMAWLADTPAFAQESAWKTCCGEVKDAKKECVIRQAMLLNKKIVATASFGMTVPEGKPTGAITLPVNVMLSSGAIIKVDESKSYKAAFDRCNPQGCRTKFAMTDEFLKDLIAGKSLNVSWTLADGKPGRLRFNLKGFSAAWSSAGKAE